MDKHLNLFCSFSQNQAKQHIEDNLSRALVLCMKNDHLLFHEFLRQVLNKDDYNYLFDHYNPESTSTLDLQRNLKQESAKEYTKVYGLTLTCNKYEVDDLLKQYTYNKSEDYRPETDILITLNDILIVIEVKRHGEDCRQQLYNQLHQLFAEDAEDAAQIDDKKVVLESLTWHEVMQTVMRVSNFHQLTGYQNAFLLDFIDLIQQFNAEWLPMQPLSLLNEDNSNNALRQLRLQSAIKSAEDDKISVLSYSDRMGFEFKENWVSELLFWMERRKDDGTLCLCISMWPGNTKGQGWSLYYHNNLKWREKAEIKIQNHTYPLEHSYHLKFTSFQRYFSSVDFTDQHLKKGEQICNKHNFSKYSGRIKKEDWEALSHFFDNTFDPAFDWRAACDWDGKILKSGKTQFDVSFGFQCCVRIPYSHLQAIDKEVRNGTGLNKFVKDAYEAFKKLNTQNSLYTV